MKEVDRVYDGHIEIFGKNFQFQDPYFWSSPNEESIRYENITDLQLKKISHQLRKSGDRNWFIEEEQRVREVVKLLSNDKHTIALWLTSPDDRLRKIAERANESNAKNTKIT